MGKLVIKFMYELTKKGLKKLFDIKEDTENKPEILQCSRVIQRLKEASNKAHLSREGTLNKWRRKT